MILNFTILKLNITVYINLDFAHKYVGVLWLFTGVLLFMISILIFYVFRNHNINALGEIVILITIIQIVGMFVPILPTELILRKRFDENGNKK